MFGPAFSIESHWMSWTEHGEHDRTSLNDTGGAFDQSLYVFLSKLGDKKLLFYEENTIFCD